MLYDARAKKILFFFLVYMCASVYVCIMYVSMCYSYGFACVKVYAHMHIENIGDQKSPQSLFQVIVERVSHQTESSLTELV